MSLERLRCSRMSFGSAVALGELLEHVLGGRRLPGRRLAHHRQLHLLEQDVAELLGRIEVERRAGFLVRLAEHFHEPLGEFSALRAQHLPVEQHAVLFHAQQHRHQRLFAFFVQRLERGHGGDLRPQHLVQAQRDVGVLGGIFGGLVDRHLAEGDLLGALAGDVFVVNGADAEITLRGRVHVVAQPRCSRRRTPASSRSACRAAGCRGCASTCASYLR